MEIKLRRDLAYIWIRFNPVLDVGEPGFEIDTNQLKIGDGIRSWTQLPYINSSSGGGTDLSALANHIVSPTPHPIYDDGPSLTLLYTNAKV